MYLYVHQTSNIYSQRESILLLHDLKSITSAKKCLFYDNALNIFQDTSKFYRICTSIHDERVSISVRVTFLYRYNLSRHKKNFVTKNYTLISFFILLLLRSLTGIDERESHDKSYHFIPTFFLRASVEYTIHKPTKPMKYSVRCKKKRHDWEMKRYAGRWEIAHN